VIWKLPWGLVVGGERIVANENDIVDEFKVEAAMLVTVIWYIPLIIWYEQEIPEIEFVIGLQTKLVLWMI
jgi:hypothetical protein